LVRSFDRVPERYAVIDAGTNSIKFHVAELDADGRGPWRTVVDRAIVTGSARALRLPARSAPARSNGPRT
jgi:exopolyphosphatase / guanosine-5'-triphosphate,3'-diphosphate pyrophosphatase